MGVIVVEGVQYADQLGNSGENHQDVKELMGGAVYVKFTWPSAFGELGL